MNERAGRFPAGREGVLAWPTTGRASLEPTQAREAASLPSCKEVPVSQPSMQRASEYRLGNSGRF
ncbi:MAG: hypothetical protein LBK00_07030 [Treponema sp.]|nr:hypothetical protein [Treponema sp.]